FCLSFSRSRSHPLTTPFPYTTLFRSEGGDHRRDRGGKIAAVQAHDQDGKRQDHQIGDEENIGGADHRVLQPLAVHHDDLHAPWIDRKSTRLNSSHVSISYAVFCLKKK